MTTSFCLVGPGDEVRLEFEASGLPALAGGLDAQLCAARVSATARTPTRSRRPATPVEPLPWRGMPAFPFGPDVKRRPDAAYESYLREFQTRPAGGGD